MNMACGMGIPGDVTAVADASTYKPSDYRVGGTHGQLRYSIVPGWTCLLKRVCLIVSCSVGGCELVTYAFLESAAAKKTDIQK